MQDLQSHSGIVRDGKEFFALMERCGVDKQKGKMREEGIMRERERKAKSRQGTRGKRYCKKYTCY